LSSQMFLLGSHGPIFRKRLTGLNREPWRGYVFISLFSRSLISSWCMVRWRSILFSAPTCASLFVSVDPPCILFFLSVCDIFPVLSWG
jgi:hypothetical protein